MKTKKKKNYSKKNKNSSNSFLMIGNFNYKLNEKELDFINSYDINDPEINFNEKFNLKIEYLKFKKGQELKGYDKIFITFDVYLELYKVLKNLKSRNFALDYALYNDKIRNIISDIALNQLKIYIDNEILTKSDEDVISFRSIYVTDKELSFKVRNNTYLFLVHSDRYENINIRTYEKFEPEVFLKNVFNYGYFPMDPIIFEHYRKLHGQYMSAAKSLFYNKLL